MSESTFKVYPSADQVRPTVAPGGPAAGTMGRTEVLSQLTFIILANIFIFSRNFQNMLFFSKKSVFFSGSENSKFPDFLFFQIEIIGKNHRKILRKLFGEKHFLKI